MILPNKESAEVKTERTHVKQNNRPSFDPLSLKKRVPLFKDKVFGAV